MNIVILATRISGIDGVSLEVMHWKKILERMGHKVTLVAGSLDQAGVLMPELHFQSPKIMNIHDRVVYGRETYRKVEANIFDVAGTIEGKLRQFFNSNKNYDLVITPNTLSLPMHFPLAVALSRVIEELKIPTIARHHDFWWERKRYLKSHLFAFFERWFPPKIPYIKHIVINSIAQKSLMEKKGIEAEIIGDSFDFGDKKLAEIDSFSGNFRKDFGMKKDDIVFLQATRIVPRKRLEVSVDFVKKLKNKKAFLIFAGKAGDEGFEYFKKIKAFCRKSGVRYRFIGSHVNSKRRVVALTNGDRPVRKRIYTLWDCYNNSDFVLYPTSVEGFGNQFVEAVYFRKPIIVTPYPVYEKDIKPLGFETIEIRGNIGRKEVEKVLELIENKDAYKKMVGKNFEIGKKYFSYSAVTKKLARIFKEMNLS